MNGDHGYPIGCTATPPKVYFVLFCLFQNGFVGVRLAVTTFTYIYTYSKVDSNRKATVTSKWADLSLKSTQCPALFTSTVLLRKCVFAWLIRVPSPDHPFQLS